MDLSGIIFVVLAVGWAVYLVPKALKHHDEIAGSRSVDRFSHTMRVLGRGKADAGEDSEPTVGTDVSSLRRSTPEQEQPVPVAGPVARPVVRAQATRATARAAAKRRRRVLYVLVFALAVVSSLSGFAILPWWSTAVPGALIVGFLVLSRVLGARERSSRRRVSPVVAAPVDAVEERSPAVTEEQLVAGPVLDDGSLWDPLPMTLPTYVNKARAPRTVRTIDLTEPETWSSGRSEADSELVRRSEEAAEATADEAEQRRAAGA